ncbi:MAG: hypothetical protein KDD67_04010, partial [Ignavibacteriae bacterium]|nr:hypothetical protein [Ignavibacteriota bacterium]
GLLVGGSEEKTGRETASSRFPLWGARERVDNHDSQKGRTAGAPEQRCRRIPRASARGYQPTVAPRRNRIVTEEPQRGDPLVAWSESSGHWEPTESVAPEERSSIVGRAISSLAIVNTL